jgi:V/A-type H+-transporting ATPase subunit A
MRRARPVAARLPADRPAGDRPARVRSAVPGGRGGKAAIPGGFGTGKTVLLEALAKYCDADVIIYLGCGERGNEMAGVLDEFPTLTDPRTGRALMERTVHHRQHLEHAGGRARGQHLLRITVAEYFRDQGCTWR